MYTKLFGAITDSTIWREDDHTRIVWITMLAIADRHGEVMASVPGLADRARVNLEKTLEALRVLASPDKWSRSQEYDGCRIAVIGGGWRILNYEKYRRINDEEERRRYMRDYMRNRRKGVNKSVNNVSNVSSSKHKHIGLTQAEAEADTDKASNSSKPSKSKTPSEVLAGSNSNSEDLILEIAKLYPKIADPQHLSPEVTKAISDAIARHGRDDVFKGTRGMAEIIATWPRNEKRFLPSPARYFRDSEYLKHPQEWERSNGKPPSEPVNQKCELPGHVGLTNWGTCWTCYEEKYSTQAKQEEPSQRKSSKSKKSAS